MSTALLTSNAEPMLTSITVGGTTRRWAEGKVLAFDDSFMHDVAHHGKQPRIVLIVDMWHPLMSEAM